MPRGGLWLFTVLFTGLALSVVVPTLVVRPGIGLWIATELGAAFTLSALVIQCFRGAASRPRLHRIGVAGMLVVYAVGWHLARTGLLVGPNDLTIAVLLASFEALSAAYAVAALLAFLTLP